MSQTKLNMSYVAQAIYATQQLRSTVTNVFSFLCDGFKAEEEFDSDDDAGSSSHSSNVTKETKKFLFRFQNYLQAVNQDYNEVEKYCNSITTHSELQILGPSGSLSQDSVLDKTGIYRNISLAYQWHHKLHDYAQVTVSLMSNNTARKSIPQPQQAILFKKRRPVPQKFINTSSNNHKIDTMLQNFAHQLKDSTLKVIQRTGELRVLQLTVGRVFNAFIAMRYLYFEKILVKGISEDFHNEDGTVDFFSPSLFESMRVISDHATSAMLDYTVSSGHPEIVLRFMLLWLQSYKNLFTEKCSVCGKHLFAGLPPLWRDFRNFSVISHDTCRY